jgi:hypothetical protein
MQTVVQEASERLSNNSDKLVQTLQYQAKVQSRGSQLNFMRTAIADNRPTTLRTQFLLEQKRQEEIVWSKIAEIEEIYKRKLVKQRLDNAKNLQLSHAKDKRVESLLKRVKESLQPDLEPLPPSPAPSSPAPSTPSSQDSEGRQELDGHIGSDTFDEDTQFDEDGHHVHDPEEIAERKRDFFQSQGRHPSLPPHIAHWDPQGEYEEEDKEEQTLREIDEDNAKLEREKHAYLRKLCDARQENKRGSDDGYYYTSSSSSPAPRPKAQPNQHRPAPANSRRSETAPTTRLGPREHLQNGDTRRVSFQDHNDQDGSHYELTDKEIEEARQYTLKVQHLPTDQTLRPRQSPTRKRKASKASKPKAPTTKARPKAKDFFEDSPPNHSPLPDRKHARKPPKGNQTDNDTDDNDEWDSAASSPELVVVSSGDEDATPATLSSLFKLLEQGEVGGKETGLGEILRLHDAWNAHNAKKANTPSKDKPKTNSKTTASTKTKPRKQRTSTKDKDGAGAGSGTRN